MNKKKYIILILYICSYFIEASIPIKLITIDKVNIDQIVSINLKEVVEEFLLFFKNLAPGSKLNKAQLRESIDNLHSELLLLLSLKESLGLITKFPNYITIYLEWKLVSHKSFGGYFTIKEQISFTINQNNHNELVDLVLNSPDMSEKDKIMFRYAFMHNDKTKYLTTLFITDDFRSLNQLSKDDKKKLLDSYKNMQSDNNKKSLKEYKKIKILIDKHNASSLEEELLIVRIVNHIKKRLNIYGGKIYDQHPATEEQEIIASRIVIEYEKILTNDEIEDYNNQLEGYENQKLEDYNNQVKDYNNKQVENLERMVDILIEKKNSSLLEKEVEAVDKMLDTKSFELYKHRAVQFYLLKKKKNKEIQEIHSNIIKKREVELKQEKDKKLEEEKLNKEKLLSQEKEKSDKKKRKKADQENRKKTERLEIKKTMDNSTKEDLESQLSLLSFLDLYKICKIIDLKKLSSNPKLFQLQDDIKILIDDIKIDDIKIDDTKYQNILLSNSHDIILSKIQIIIKKEKEVRINIEKKRVEEEEEKRSKQEEIQKEQDEDAKTKKMNEKAHQDKQINKSTNPPKQYQKKKYKKKKKKKKEDGAIMIETEAIEKLESKEDYTSFSLKETLKDLKEVLEKDEENNEKIELTKEFDEERFDETDKKDQRTESFIHELNKKKPDEPSEEKKRIKIPVEVFNKEIWDELQKKHKEDLQN